MILDLYEENKQEFQLEHTVLSFRILGKYSRQIKDSESKEVFEKIQNHLNLVIDEVSDQQLLDVIFALRRFKQSRIPLSISQKTYEKITLKINDFISQKTYNFQNLVNIFYDTSLQGRVNDACLQELINIVKTDKSQLTPDGVSSIFQACYIKNKNQLQKEWILLSQIAQNLGFLIDEFEPDKKAQLFKHMSYMEFQFNFPSFKVYPVQYTLRKDLLDKLELLSETSILNIFQAYHTLPNTFPLDVLFEIRDVILATMQSNPQNLKTDFLIDLLQESYQKKRLGQEYFNLIQKEIAKRILEEEEVDLDKVSKIATNMQRNADLVSALKLRVTKDDLFTIEYLASQRVNVDNLISQIDIEQMKDLKLIKLYQALKWMNDKDFLAKKVEEKILSQKIEYVVYHAGVHLQNDKKLMYKIGLKLRDELIGNERKAENSMKMILDTCCSKELREMWYKYLINQDALQDKSFWIKFFDSLDMIENLQLDQISFMFQLIRRNIGNFSMYRFFGSVKYSQKMCHEISRNEFLFNGLMSIMTQMVEKEEDLIKLHFILSIIIRLEQSGQRSRYFTKLLAQCYELQKQHLKRDFVNDLHYINYMIKYEALTPSDANVLLHNLKHVDIFQQSRLFRWGYKENDNLDDLGHSLANELATKLQGDKLGPKLLSMIALLGLPTKFIKNDIKLIENMIKNNISKITERIYFQCINQLNVEEIRENQPIYQNILTELQLLYSNHSKRMAFGDMVMVMEQFAKLRSINAQLCNNFLNDIAKNFNSCFPEQRVRCMQVFSSVRIKQDDFILKNLEKVNQNPNIYSSYLYDLFGSLYILGFAHHTAINMIVNIVKAQQHLSLFDIINILQYCTLFKGKQLQEVINCALDKSNFSKITSIQNAKRMVIVHEYLKYNGFTQQAQTLLSKIAPDHYSQFYDQTFGTKKQTPKHAIQLISSYLDCMSVNHFVNHVKDDFLLDIFLPESNTIIIPVTEQNLNYDKVSLSGGIASYVNIVESKFVGSKVIALNFYELENSGMDHIKKVEFLQSRGIESNNTSGKYDFSKMKNK